MTFPPKTFQRGLFAVLAVFFALALSAQDTLSFDQYYAPTRSRDSVYFLEVRHCDPADTNRCTVLTFFANGNMISAVKYSNFSRNERNGKSTYWNKNQQLSREVPYKDGKRQGVQKVFYASGQLKSAITFDQDTIVQGSFFNEDGSPKTQVFEDDLNFEEEQQVPDFPGGPAAMLMYLNYTLKYPPLARENNLQGVVLVSFVVEKNGAITDVKVIKSVAPDIDKEALRVVRRMPRWAPGRVDDVPVRVRFDLPIRFRLE